ncbi:MAG TPA: TlpA disulfide reductase family protein [Spirochaetota bacterium]|nr:TlpA disulfide reductase family protein [Spirochaetota bacterium]
MKIQLFRRYLLPVLLMFVLGIVPLYPLGMGDRAPLVNIRQRDGGMFILAQYRNKKHVIMSFFHHDCLPCVPEIVHLQKLKKSCNNLEVIVVSDVDTDSSKAESFLKKVERRNGAPLTLRVGVDPFGDTKSEYRVTRHPTLFLIDTQGHIIYTATGYS